MQICNGKIVKKSLVNSGIDEKSERMKIIQPNIPFFDRYGKMKYCGLQVHIKFEFIK